MRKIKTLLAMMALVLVMSLGAPQALAGDMGCPPGFTGEISTPGYTGPQETPGVTGEIGMPGVAGDIGTPGVAGDIPYPGITGEMGFPGALWGYIAALFG